MKIVKIKNLNILMEVQDHMMALEHIDLNLVHNQISDLLIVIEILKYIQILEFQNFKENLKLLLKILQLIKIILY